MNKLSDKKGEGGKKERNGEIEKGKKKKHKKREGE